MAQQSHTPVAPQTPVPHVYGSSGISFGALKNYVLAFVHGQRTPEADAQPQPANSGQ